MTDVRFAPGALQDLRQVLDYASRDGGTAAADRILLQVFAAAAKLAAMPRMGPLWRGRADARLRTWMVYRYVLVYAPDRVPLEIVRILHSARDPDWVDRTLRDS